MKTRDLETFVFNGKNYSLLSRTFQDAFFSLGLLTFRYYPEEKIMIVSDRFVETCHASKVYSNMPYSFADTVIAEEDRQNFYKLIEKLENGEKKVSDTFESVFGGCFRITIVPCEWNSDGKAIVALGFAENIEKQNRSERLFRALAKDYGSIYYVDVEKGTLIPYRISDDIQREYGESIRKNSDYVHLINYYIDKTVVDVEKDEMRRICSYKFIEECFKEKDVILHDYRGVRDGKTIYCRLKIAKLGNSEKLSDFMIAFSDMTKAKIFEVERLAYVDPITEGNNYNYFKKQLGEINKPGYFVSMDIHQFKIVNQICGIKVGDQVLKEIWNTVEKNLKEQDFAARVNADHFIVFAPISPREEIEAKIGKLTDDLSELSKKMRWPRLHPYFGIARWVPGQNIEEVYSCTTFAKHSVKDEKNVNFQFYSVEESDKVIEQKKMEDNFFDAILGNCFEIWYQPKVSPVCGRIVGAEALVRWRREDGILVPPGMFIPVFERDGLIRILDEYIFDKVCRFIKARIEAKLPVLPISVNLSRASICYEGIVEQYEKIVQDAGIDPKYVPIEITESAAVSNSDIKEISNEFCRRGFVLCMDDFGTGYSSISLLNSLPFANIKLDKSLIDTIGDEKGLKSIKHIIPLSKDLGMTITAEGVEHESQKNSLMDLKCDNIQGFFYSPPMPEKEFVKLL